MKEIVLKLYEFDELSKDSQERIIERERWNVMEQCMDAYDIDYKKSMEAFEDLTDTKVYGWEVGYERYDFSYEFKYKDPIYEHPTEKAHADCNNIEKYRLATEDERQKFIDALKTSKEPKAKMCLKQFFGIEIEPEYKFKPFDKVLVRDTEDDDWHVSLFVRKIADAQYKEERYECLNGTGWIYCIPYEGNEHLL